MPNSILSPSIIAREALMLLESNMVFGNLVFRGHQDDFTGARVGDTITVRGPATFVADEYDGATLTIQDATESSVPVTLEKHFDVSFKVSDREMSLSIADFSGQLLQPAILAIAEAVDAYVASKYVETHAVIGSAGSPPASLADLAAIDRRLNEARVPLSNRALVLDPAGKEAMFQIPSFAEADKRGDQGSALRDASMGRFMGFDHFMSQNVKSHASGTAAGSLAVNGAVTAGATSLDIDGGSGSQTLKAGDLLSFDGIEGSFVVTADKTASSGAWSSVAMSPALPALDHGTSVSLVASHVANLAFHRNAFMLAVVPLSLPKGAGMAEYVNFRGLGIRVVYDYDKDAKSDVVSLDLLAGARCQDPRLAVRVLG
ncbi:P22 phage major capsid protein family protein [Oceanibacterium hippocampi]|uniref:p22 coat protein-gene protein 5 n=1 Tax=Oceanibacterium hippocampi TaxID=745714 RepID=A0A1Y5S3J2_9PROT|nr:P22 phage major capsid protein family protein [Oceanibacterium hippocampi]SLN31824.1 P22 coat protein-gene protein 5 [Oceanibacterium hippocampi]